MLSFLAIVFRDFVKRFRADGTGLVGSHKPFESLRPVTEISVAQRNVIGASPFFFIPSSATHAFFVPIDAFGEFLAVALVLTQIEESARIVRFFLVVQKK